MEASARDAIVKIGQQGWEKSTRTKEVVDVQGIVASVLPPRIRLFEHVRPWVADDFAGRFEVCNEVPGIIAAGGCVSQMVNTDVLPSATTEVSTTMATDLDLYPRANSAAEVADIARRLCEYLRPVGDVSMSKYAITFTVDGDVFKTRVLSGGYDNNVMAHRQALYYGGFSPRVVYKVQLIAHPVPNTGDLCKDLESLFAHYDLSCCKIATDGKDVYASGDALSAVFETRINRVHWTRMHSPKRIAKYYGRRYDFEIEMPDGSVISSMPGGRRNTSAAMEEIRRSVRESYPSGVEEMSMDTDSVHMDVADKNDQKHPGYTCPVHDCIDTDACYTNTIMVQTGDRGSWWVLDAAFDRYAASKQKPTFDVICGNPDDLGTMISTGKMAQGTIADWSMMRMNKFCEEMCLCASAGADASTNADAIVEEKRQRFERDITEFIKAVSESDGLGASFADGHPLEYKTIDADDFVRRWIAPNAKRARPTDPAEASAVATAAAVPTTIDTALQEPYCFSDTDPSSLCLYDAAQSPVGVKFRISTSQHVFSKLKVYVQNMWLPAGIVQFTNDANGGGHMVTTTTLLSTGNTHNTDPRILSFKAFMESVDTRLRRLIEEAKWPLRPFVSAGIRDDLGLTSRTKARLDRAGVEHVVAYPPSIKVNIDYQTLIVEAKDGAFEVTSHRLAPHGRRVDVVFMLDWIFRIMRHYPKRWGFSSHWTLTEMLIH